MKEGEIVGEVKNVLLKVQLFELINDDDEYESQVYDGLRQRAGVEGRGRGQLVARSEPHFTLLLYLVLITVYKASAPFVFLRHHLSVLGNPLLKFFFTRTCFFELPPH